MKILAALLSGLGLMTTMAFASAPIKTYPVYFQNNTPYSIHLRLSLRNKTPLTLITQIVKPNSTVEVAVGQMVKDTAESEFGATLGDSQPVFSNTSVLTYSFNATAQSLKIQPSAIQLNNHTYIYGPSFVDPITGEADITLN